MNTERREPKKRAAGIRSHPLNQSNTSDGSSGDTEYQRPEEPPSQNVQSDVVYDKNLLWKIFGYLVEDGLQECRRVCRSWREVCSEFFTNHICVRWEDLADARLKFPNAVSVSLSILAPLECDHTAWPRLVPSLTDIKNLEMDSTFLWHYQYFASFPRRVSECFASLDQLESLTLERFDEFPHLLSSSMAAHLTNLTYLKIAPRIEFIRGTTPLSGICKLENLSLHANNLYFEDGSLTFPALTNLTRLEMMYENRNDVIFLQVCNISSRTRCPWSSHRRFVLGTAALRVDVEVLSHLLSFGMPNF